MVYSVSQYGTPLLREFQILLHETAIDLAPCCSVQSA